MKLKHLLLTILILSTLILLFSCKPKEYAVTFDADGGNEVATQVVTEGGIVTKPDTPTKEGYKFKGWYYNNTEWSFLVNTVEDNIILKAKWEKNKYTVSFDTNGGNGSTQRTVEHGETVSSAPIPTRANYSFLGWYVGDTKWNFTTDVVTSDITLVAKWEGFAKKITFNAGDGTVSEKERKVNYGDPIGELPRPTRDGFDFVGWYDSNDVNMENPITWDYTVTSKMELVAKWEMDANSVSVQFIAGEGEIADSDAIKYVQKGDFIGTLPTPTRKDYVLDYWVNDKTGEKVTSATVINENTVCVAKWKKAVYCIDGTLNHAWSNWSNSYMERTRTCAECGTSENKTFENITLAALGDHYPIIEGNVWNADNANNLINGVIEDNGNDMLVGKGSSPVTVTLNLVSPVEVDMIYVIGKGSASYTVTVTLADGTEQYLGEGSFGEACGFDVGNKSVKKVVIHMSNPSSAGTDFWQEITLAK